VSIQARACIVGAYEHPTRLAPDKSVAQLHAESALGALQDAGLSLADVDGYFCAGDAPGGSPLYLADYMNLKLKWYDGTESGGCSYLAHIEHAAAAGIKVDQAGYQALLAELQAIRAEMSEQTRAQKLRAAA
jgi:acetyl-CoA C-acetyltransferase